MQMPRPSSGRIASTSSAAASASTSSRGQVVEIYQATVTGTLVPLKVLTGDSPITEIIMFTASSLVVKAIALFSK